ncbi:class I SAM-dependent methyltransferase [Microcella daejeonensis]|uniref:Class I SAM-dependent methyltransferase n=1 Tax=Microcella daejeonensis TaxID=2994971 RepID=A0A9E8MIP7_9MICO|nr:class I SAM-dependent methyltransferase [Microcella daejeonensis]WAB80289.1 class I SAM-dependent methyltransferase [Microcella daejeonensis]
MDTSELRELLTPEALGLLEQLPPSEGAPDAVRLVSRLRKEGHPPARVAAVLTQYRLRRKAVAKFGPFAERMLFTAPGLEQASRLAVAAQHAGRFRAAGLGSVADLGCGIGGDSMAFSALDLRVTAVERDEATAAVASYNLAPWVRTTVELGDATAFDVERAEGLWLDPARREGARRLSSPDDFSPSLDAALALAAQRPTGIKLAPGMDRALLPEGLEAQWVSDGGEVVELVLWSGALARDGIGRAALVLGAEGSAELTAAQDSADAPAGDLGEYLYEPDGAVIRARLIGDLARRLGGRMLDETIAWITADRLESTPFARAFRVLERWPLDAKRIGRELKQRGIGTVEIKKRGVDIDPAAFRKQLKPQGEGSATLVLTRVAGERAALLVERCD